MKLSTTDGYFDPMYQASTVNSGMNYQHQLKSDQLGAPGYLHLFALLILWRMMNFPTICCIFFFGDDCHTTQFSYRDSETYAMIFPILEGEPIRMTHGSCRIGGFCSRCSTGATAGFLPTGWVLTSHKP